MKEEVGKKRKKQNSMEMIAYSWRNLNHEIVECTTTHGKITLHPSLKCRNLPSKSWPSINHAQKCYMTAWGRKWSYQERLSRSFALCT